ncbi:MAG: hypothetical protein EA369_07590 [Bradymonadales bacterium]|nr:MAG: hypothetical protein EA369_07590 [Bradymonadales bacterium]
MLSSIRNYAPLLWILALTGGLAYAVELRSESWHWESWMHSFMGFFFVLLALFKLVNLRGFADGFQKYDLLAQQWRPYAFAYPFLELGLGFGYLVESFLVPLYLLTIGLMLFGLGGILLSLKRGYQFRCACLGTVLNVKLSHISVLENLGMAAMAGFMLMISFLE